jgi:hypothetical protein
MVRPSCFWHWARFSLSPDKQNCSCILPCGWMWSESRLTKQYLHPPKSRRPKRDNKAIPKMARPHLSFLWSRVLVYSEFIQRSRRWRHQRACPCAFHLLPSVQIRWLYFSTSNCKVFRSEIGRNLDFATYKSTVNEWWGRQRTGFPFTSKGFVLFHCNSSFYLLLKLSFFCSLCVTLNHVHDHNVRLCPKPRNVYDHATYALEVRTPQKLLRRTCRSEEEDAAKTQLRVHSRWGNAVRYVETASRFERTGFGP